MKFLNTLLLIIMSTCAMSEKNDLTIVIHGGAGTILKENLTDETEAAIRKDLGRALDAGYAVLEKKGDATAAVIAAITILEDSPHFNAGKGAVYTRKAEHELDASLMRGNDLQAGAVAGVKHVKNPILAAQAVMLNSPHVMLSGAGADSFAKEQQLELVENDYFDTESRYESWQEVDAKQQKAGASADDVLAAEFKFGTVGAVAIDANGNIAAGTSTGGMTYKAYGRIGDSPVIGSGTYADNRSCGISATGHGEYFIRYAVAHNICSRVRWANASLTEAANAVIHDELLNAGGSGGVIGLDAAGKPIMIFNTKGMYRGYKTSAESDAYIGIYEK
ncbi:isoaspartyl peptidase/L-asparaginase family protein [Marinicella sp. W31]|uniref:isoaspartyl peptidase/L-asparaginase family protein n=1 Tax=Marinicella sp. W31 TaxID=3023713 RepID=UPI0037570295